MEDHNDSTIGFILPYITVLLILAVQIYFWFPASTITTNEEEEDLNVTDDVLGSSTAAPASTNTLDTKHTISKTSVTSSSKLTSSSPTATRTELPKDDFVSYDDVNDESRTTQKSPPPPPLLSPRTAGNDRKQISNIIKSIENKEHTATKNDGDLVAIKNTTASESGDNQNDNNRSSSSSSNNNNWRCVCETGFLPAGMLKSLGSAESVLRLGTGQCYHKQV